MKKVYKYIIWEPLVFGGHSDYPMVKMPHGAEILCVQVQRQSACVWALVDLDAPMEERRFRLAGTGHPIKEENLKYIGTFQLIDGDFIGHLFEILGGKSE